MVKEDHGRGHVRVVRGGGYGRVYGRMSVHACG